MIIFYGAPSVTDTILEVIANAHLIEIEDTVPGREIVTTGDETEVDLVRGTGTPTEIGNGIEVETVEPRPDRRDEPMKSVETTTDHSDGSDKMDVSNDLGDHADGEGDEMDAQMKAMMGFGGFGTTKQKKIPGNDAYAVHKEKKTEYRQYMFVSSYSQGGNNQVDSDYRNRIGGFNRPLSPS
ncbi:MAG: hypothetical protein M1837_006668 [Sclerophora amabilis]|nr:MAG: hypothetical protein M1837_006668 [Sclerophora amabilis]